jgi:hypothetical protein
MAAPHSTRRWIVVADSPFLPARGGGEREHLGFVEAATKAGLLELGRFLAQQLRLPALLRQHNLEGSCCTF